MIPSVHDRVDELEALVAKMAIDITLLQDRLDYEFVSKDLLADTEWELRTEMKDMVENGR